MNATKLGDLQIPIGHALLFRNIVKQIVKRNASEIASIERRTEKRSARPKEKTILPIGKNEKLNNVHGLKLILKRERQQCVSGEKETQKRREI